MLGKTALDKELLHTNLQLKPFILHFWQKAWPGECVSVQMTVWTEFWLISKHISSKSISNALALQLDTQQKNPINTTLQVSTLILIHCSVSFNTVWKQKMLLCQFTLEFNNKKHPSINIRRDHKLSFKYWSCKRQTTIWKHSYKFILYI